MTPIDPLHPTTSSCSREPEAPAATAGAGLPLLHLLAFLATVAAAVSFRWLLLFLPLLSFLLTPVSHGCAASPAAAASSLLPFRCHFVLLLLLAPDSNASAAF